VSNKHKVIFSGDVRFDEQPAQQQTAQHSPKLMHQLKAVLEQLDQSRTAADIEH
jgi:ATP-dependent exoDNAse (exonuclease V) alpha subunit